MTSPSSDTTRLYITPFTSELLPLVLPASIRPSATDISFHNIPTFPENSYGYVTLPKMDADKIKKKLNGSILKGRKFKVDTARPQKRHRDDDDVQEVLSKHTSSSDKKSKKRKGGDNVLDGHELSSDRKVKRGWTESANDKVERRKKEKKEKGKEEGASKSQTKSKYTEKSECLFRTRVPPNKSSSVDEKSSKQSKKKNKASSEKVVHEFSKTLSHPSFLRSEDGSAPLTSTFEDGKGWLDESGQVKEQTSDRIRKEKFRPGQVEGHKEKSRPRKAPLETGKPTPPKSKSRDAAPSEEKESVDESEDWTSSSGSSSSEDDTTDLENGDSESSSTPEDSDATSEEDEEDSLATNLEPEGEKSEDSTSVSSTASDQAGSTGLDNQLQEQEVHPLEALFKRPAPVSSGAEPESAAPAHFSFFGQEDLESEEEGEGQEEEAREPPEPLTPFTKKDMHGRGLRSAAPTPDTSQVSRSINWNLPGNLDASVVVTSPSSSTPVPKSEAGLKDESDFAKWFWENRGDNNRAWKRRRREVSKEQRQRENRRTGMKGKS